MSNSDKRKILIFFPTSPVHISNFKAVSEIMEGWRMIGLSHSPMNRYIPGLNEAFEKNGFEYIIVDDASSLNSLLPEETSLVLIGAVHEICAIELFIWAKQKLIPVAAIEEVAQLSLNNSEIYNYNLPFDRLFVANRKEYELFRSLGHPAESIRISGLLPGISPRSIRETCMREEAAPKIGIPDDKPLLIYTTSPIRHRLAIHSKDDLAFRIAILKQINYGNKARRWRIVVKLHPNEDVDRERARIQEIIPDAIVLGREVQISELLALASLVVNRGNSQTALEAALTGCPLLVVACGLKTIFHEDGGALIAENPDELPALIRRVEAGEKPDTRQLKEHNFREPPAGSAQSIAGELEHIAGASTPLSPQGWAWTVKTLLFHGFLRRAKNLCIETHNDDPFTEATGKALTLELNGKLDDAIRLWRECSAHDPSWYFPYYQMAHMHCALGDYNPTIEAAKKCIALHPAYYRIWHEIPMTILQSITLRRMGRVDDALHCITALKKYNIIDIIPEILIELGLIYYEIGNIHNSKKSIDNAILLLIIYPLSYEIDKSFWEKLADFCYTNRLHIQASICFRLLSHVNNSSESYARLIYSLINLRNIRTIHLSSINMTHNMKINNININYILKYTLSTKVIHANHKFTQRLKLILKYFSYMIYIYLLTNVIEPIREPSCHDVNIFK
ncbi:MAG: tetratricopeptide repeat protein [Syntrophobacteraceae bacterium]